MSAELAHLSDVTRGLGVWFPAEPPAHARRLLETLGVTVNVDPFAIRRGAS